MFGAGNKKFRWFMPPSLKICWAECNKTVCGFGLDCAKLSGLSAWVAWQLNTIQTKSTHDLAHLAQQILSDGGMNHLNFLLPASNIKKIISMNSRLMWLFSNTNFSRANWKKIPWDKLEGKLFSRVKTNWGSKEFEASIYLVYILL